MTETTTETQKTASADPELRALKRVSDALSGLDETTRRRVVRYFSDRYLPVAIGSVEK